MRYASQLRNAIAGYHYSAPFLSDKVIDTSCSHVNPLYKHMLHPGYKGTLSFVGIPLKIVPFPQFELQTKLVARLLSGAAQLPSHADMEDWMEHHYGCAACPDVPARRGVCASVCVQHVTMCGELLIASAQSRRRIASGT